MWIELLLNQLLQ